MARLGCGGTGLGVQRGRELTAWLSARGPERTRVGVSLLGVAAASRCGGDVGQWLVTELGSPPPRGPRCGVRHRLTSIGNVG